MIFKKMLCFNNYCLEMKIICIKDSTVMWTNANKEIF